MGLSHPGLALQVTWQQVGAMGDAAVRITLRFEL